MQDKLGPRIYFSWSALMKYATVSAINLAILLVGIAIGVMIAPRIDKTVNAYATDQQASPQQSAATNGNANPKIAQPQMTVGTAAVYLLLTHHIQADELVVNGIDLIKLHQEELNLLSRFISAQDLSKAVSNAKDTELYTLPPQTPPPTTPKPSTK
jgi:hypothetical protein